MNQSTIQCPNCGVSEATGTTFCGNCGTRLSSAGAVGDIVAKLLRRPLLSALLGGIGFSVVVVLFLAATGGSDSGPPATGTGPDNGSNGAGSTTSSSASPSPTLDPDASETPVPAATATVAAAAAAATVPAPSPTSVPPTPTTVPPSPTPIPPTSTPVPPTSTPIPLPTATSAPSIPAEKTSTLVSLSVAGGHGSSHPIGQQVVLCYSSLPGQYIRLLDFQPPGTFPGTLREGVDDGTGECLNGTIEGPAGFEVFRVEVLNSTRTSVVDFAELWIIVVP